MAAPDTRSELEKQLEQEIEAERAALQAEEQAREKAKRERQLRSELEDTKRKRREEQALEKAETEFGEIGKSLERLDTIDGMVLVKASDPIKVRRWQDTHMRGDQLPTVDACREIGRPCVVYPELADFDAIAKERPYVMVHVAGAVCKLAGSRLGGTGKG